MPQKGNRVILKLRNFVGIALLSIVIFPHFISAATLSVIPTVSSVSVGDTFKTTIVVNTQNKAINNSEGTVQFPADMLQVVSLSKTGSIFSLWIEEPSYSNTAGTITYNGGVPNPGVIGADVNVITITFKAKKSGEALITLANAAVRENDGMGTDILTSKNSAVLTIKDTLQPKVVPIDQPVQSDQSDQQPITDQQIKTTKDTPVKSVRPDKPVIIADTHPNQDSWYSGDATFSWKIPAGVTSIQTSINKIANSVPTVTYDSSVTQKTIKSLADGVWYFHMRYKNDQGYGSTEHFKIQVDNTAPLAFTPNVSNDSNDSFVTLDAQDKTSGISHYEIQIDNNPLVKVNKEDIIDGKYKLPILGGGQHTMVVSAYDKAQNVTNASVSFTSRALKAPELSFATRNIKQDETATIVGTSEYPGQNVTVVVTVGNNEPLTYTTKAAPDGSFTVTTDPIQLNGSVTAWGYISFSDTVKSEKSDTIYLLVEKLTILEHLFKITPYVADNLPKISLIVLLVCILFFALYKFINLKRKINREAEEILSSVHTSVTVLKTELNKQLQELEKLNKKERDIFNDIKHAIDNIDSFIDTKINKLKK